MTGDMGELFNALKEHGKEKRAHNLKASIQILRDQGIAFRELSDTHYRIGAFDFWPSTGLFIHVPTKKRGRGVHNLIRQLDPKRGEK